MDIVFGLRSCCCSDAEAGALAVLFEAHCLWCLVGEGSTDGIWDIGNDD